MLLFSSNSSSDTRQDGLRLTPPEIPGSGSPISELRGDLFPWCFPSDFPDCHEHTFQQAKPKSRYWKPQSRKSYLLRGAHRKRYDQSSSVGRESSRVFHSGTFFEFCLQNAQMFAPYDKTVSDFFWWFLDVIFIAPEAIVFGHLLISEFNVFNVILYTNCIFLV